MCTITYHIRSKHSMMHHSFDFIYLPQVLHQIQSSTYCLLLAATNCPCSLLTKGLFRINVPASPPPPLKITNKKKTQISLFLNKPVVLQSKAITRANCSSKRQLSLLPHHFIKHMHASFSVYQFRCSLCLANMFSLSGAIAEFFMTTSLHLLVHFVLENQQRLFLTCSQTGHFQNCLLLSPGCSRCIHRLQRHQILYMRLITNVSGGSLHICTCSVYRNFPCKLHLDAFWPF